jgi:hypothetical protein
VEEADKNINVATTQFKFFADGSLFKADFSILPKTHSVIIDIPLFIGLFLVAIQCSQHNSSK